MKKRASTINKVWLTTLSIILITIICNTGRNKEWFYGRTLKNWKTSIVKAGDDIDELKSHYWGKPYAMSMIVKKNFDTSDIDSPVILFEPNDFYKSNKINFSVPEPITFYYFTGLRSVWVNSKNVYDATHFVTVNKEQMLMQAAPDSIAIKNFLNYYKDYKPSL